MAYCELRAWHDFSTASVSKGANQRFRNLVSTKTIIWLPKTCPTEYLCYLCGLSFKALHSALLLSTRNLQHSAQRLRDHASCLSLSTVRVHATCFAFFRL